MTVQYNHPCCDLHTHSTESDGSDSPADLVARAAEAGLAAIALTDHDTLAGLAEAAHAGDIHGVEVLPGVELSVVHPGGNMHMLGYFIHPGAPGLEDVLSRVQEARAQRNPKILAKLEALHRPVAEAELEALAQGGQIGRPHIARAMVNHGYVKSVGEAFARYLKTGAPAYVPKSILRPEEAIAAIHGAGGVAVLAHPFSLGEGEKELAQLVGQLKALGLDGLECYYSEHSPTFTEFCLDLCRTHDLVATGGSDYHGKAKPHIQIGRGRGNLCIPCTCVEALKRRRDQRDDRGRA